MQSLASPEPSDYSGYNKAGAGIIEQSREYLLGRSVSRWLDKTGTRAFQVVETHMEQAEAGQAIINNLIENARLGILPTRKVMTPSGEFVDQEMSPLDFGKKLVDLISTSGENVDRAITVRNKVSSGGVNFAAAAILLSEKERLKAVRLERSANPSRKLGVDALRNVPESIDI